MPIEIWAMVGALVVVLVVVGLVNLWLLENHPAAWHALNQQAHERRQGWLQRQHDNNMARRQRNYRALGAAGGLLKLFLGGR